MILFSHGLEIEVRGKELFNGKIGQLRQKRRLDFFT